MKMTKEMCEQHFATLDIDVQQWIICVAMELKAAQTKHAGWTKDFIHAAAVVTEECGELVQAAVQFQYEKGRYYNMHKEAVQTAAMCIRFLINAPEIKNDKKPKIGSK
jgi:NTP pyrophosphatase (non-canonical NTP hydrolase)